jgi:mycothiol synthase
MNEIALAVVHELEESHTQQVLNLIRECAHEDGYFPFSEHVLLHLRHGGDLHVTHVLATINGVLAGYAHLDITDDVDGPSAELAVSPRFRRLGVGTRLLSALMVLSRPRALRLWAHGQDAAATQLAHNFGFDKVRTLWQMRRSLLSPLKSASLPQDVTLRSFDPNTDADAWLECNRMSFINHPEQGRWTSNDLAARMKEDWFNPEGFLVAEHEGTMVGFHWTKVHGATDHDNHIHEPIGEIYVLGVVPEWQGRGLGKALTMSGLEYLRDLGLTQAMLYVNSEDTLAMHLYESLGFARWDTDTLFRDPLVPWH